MSSLRDHKVPVQRLLYATLDDPTKRDVKDYLRRRPELKYSYTDLKPYNICYIYLAHRVWVSMPANPMSYLTGAPLGIGFTPQASVRQLRALRMSHVLDAMRWHPEYRAMTPEQRSQYLDGVYAHLHKNKYPYNMDGCPRCGVPTYYGNVSRDIYHAVKSSELHVAELASKYWRPILREDNPNKRHRVNPHQNRPPRLYPAAEDNPAGYKVSCSACKAEDIRLQELDIRTPEHYNPRWMDLGHEHQDTIPHC